MPDTRPPLARKRKEVPLEAGVRLHERVQDQPESIQRQVLALQKVFLTVGALKPVGLLTEALKRDWQASVLRLAQTKVAESESVTIQNALRTYGELHAFLLHRGRSFPPDFVDMDNFLHQGTMAPTRAQCASLVVQAFRSSLGSRPSSYLPRVEEEGHLDEEPSPCGGARHAAVVGGAH